MKRKPTITIGISAYNEEQMIPKLLESIKNQKLNSATIARIVFVLDGCTDRSEENVRTYTRKIPALTIISHHTRRGTAMRLTEIYRTVTTDFFVGFDADIILSAPTTIEELVKPFKNPAVALVGGNDIPNEPKHFFERLCFVYELYWKDVVKNLPSSSTPHNIPGRVYAARKDFITSIKIPKYMYANDHFLFFKAVAQKHSVAYAPRAKVYFQLPKNLHDYISQTTRFLHSGGDIITYFGRWTIPYYHIPKIIKLKSYLRTFDTHPWLLVGALLLQVVQRIGGVVKPLSTKKGFWSTVTSSKSVEATIE